MVTGVAEVYAGVIDDPLFGPAVCFGPRRHFVEIFGDVRTELCRPLSRDDAHGDDPRHQGGQILTGRPGRAPPATWWRSPTLLARLGHSALAHAGRFRALDLNPVIVKAPGDGVVAVDIRDRRAAAGRRKHCRARRLLAQTCGQQEGPQMSYRT